MIRIWQGRITNNGTNQKTYLSMLAIVISDILRRELYVLPYDG